MRIELDEKNSDLLEVKRISVNTFDSGAIKIEIEFDSDDFIISMSRAVPARNNDKAYYDLEFSESTWRLILCNIRFIAEDNLDDKIITDSYWVVDKDDDWVISSAIPNSIYSSKHLKEKISYKNDI